MKYYLAIDKGNYYKRDKRYIKISLSSIADMEVNNNLKRLCTFTMTFESEEQLKEFLVAKKLLPKQLKFYDLVIVYNLKNIRTMDVPYASEEKLFDIRTLAEVIIAESKKGEFMDLFLEFFEIDWYKPEEYFELKEAYFNPYAMFVLYDKILRFLYRYCYKMNNGHEYFSYKSLCDIVLLVKKLKNKTSKKEEIPVFVKRNAKGLEDAQTFKLREEHSNSDILEGQMNLFKM